MKSSKRALALLLGLMLLLTALGGCAKSGEETEPAGSAVPTESAAPAEEASVPERADGEQFETTIMVEGMEETVRYQHARNETAGFAMDFEYETFTRQSEPDRERFVSVYDDPANPENYIEVAYRPEDAETVYEQIRQELSQDYALYTDTVELDGAGTCMHIDASAAADGSHTADILQAVYVIPAGDGCRVARLHYLPEGSDGFGKRLFYMVNTITVFDVT